MSNTICCKIKAPFRFGGVLYDQVGSLFYASPKAYEKLSAAKCLVRVQDPKVVEPEVPATEEKVEAKKSYQGYNRYQKKR